MKHTSNKLLLATGKGLIEYHLIAGKWKFYRDHFQGLSVSAFLSDDRTGYWWVALDHKHWGQKLHRSADAGKSWEEMPAPVYPKGEEIRPGVPASMKYIWTIAKGGDDQPGRLYLGTEPGGLFVSDDGGMSFSLNQSLWRHHTRPDHWFGGGRNHAGIHSVVVDPRHSSRIFVGVSCAGVFCSEDGGRSWEMKHQGLKADYLPDPFPEAGYDPHLLLSCHSHPDVLWQQNHCGVYRSADNGNHWTEITAADGSNYYGFALAVDPSNENVAWVIPALSDKLRIAIDRSLFVQRTDDGGKTWQSFRKGLPQGDCYDLVLRHALALSGDRLAFGTISGCLYVSEDRGESWKMINHSLPRVFSTAFLAS
ncbi:MAG: sialidase family protein [Bacteroidia bacterium]